MKLLDFNFLMAIFVSAIGAPRDFICLSSTHKQKLWYSSLFHYGDALCEHRLLT